MRHLDLCSGIGGFALAARLKALGNAIVPQVAYQIFRAIGAAEH